MDGDDDESRPTAISAAEAVAAGLQSLEDCAKLPLNKVPALDSGVDGQQLLHPSLPLSHAAAVNTDPPSSSTVPPGRNVNVHAPALAGGRSPALEKHFQRLRDIVQAGPDPTGPSHCYNFARMHLAKLEMLEPQQRSSCATATTSAAPLERNVVEVGRVARTNYAAETKEQQVIPSLALVHTSGPPDGGKCTPEQQIAFEQAGAALLLKKQKREAQQQQQQEAKRQNQRNIHNR